MKNTVTHLMGYKLIEVFIKLSLDIKAFHAVVIFGVIICESSIKMRYIGML